MPVPGRGGVGEREGRGVSRQASVALFIALMIATVVAVDVLFFRQRIWERLIANIGIVLLFAAFYLRFFGWR